MIPRLVAALTLVAIGIPMPVAAAPAQSASSSDGPCLDNVGITVVIDFQELGGGVNVRCTDGPVTSGLDALDKAGIVWQGTLRFPGVVCRIAGQPGTDTEACGNTPPLSAYWSYWVAPRGGQWCYSNLGAGTRKPPPGTVEGWSFALNRSAVDTPPPGFAPPPPIEGQAPNPLNRADCGTASNPPPTPTTTPPTTPEPTATATETVPVPQPPTTDAASEVPVATAAPNTTVRPAAGAAATSSSSATPVPHVNTSVGTTTTEPATDAVGSIAPDNAAALGATTSSVASVEATVALGTVDLGDDGRGGGGFGAATVIGIIVGGSLIAAGVWAARRRRLMARGSP